MFESLTKSFDSIRQRLSGRSKLSEKNVSDALREVRVALLEADVNFKVCKDFIQSIQDQAVGEKVIAGVNPGDQFIKAIHDGLVELMGPEDPEVRFEKDGPTVILMAGLQGSGKTTTCGKLARRFLKDGRKPLLVAADVQRPAAIEQLKVLGEQVGCPVFAVPGGDPPVICKDAVAHARANDIDTVILDTAGRLHVDDALMGELKDVKTKANPDETFLVVDAMVGQDAVAASRAFHDALSVTGAIVTKLDGTARGGAVFGIREALGLPVRYIGTGEQLELLEPFDPDAFVDAIVSKTVA